MKNYIAILLEWFNIVLGNVNIGINKYATQSRHAIGHVACVNGGITQINIIVDKPERLINPTRFVINDIFRQISKLGFEPINLEILINGEVKLYQRGRYEPLMVQPI